MNERLTPLSLFDLRLILNDMASDYLGKKEQAFDEKGGAMVLGEILDERQDSKGDPHRVVRAFSICLGECPDRKVATPRQAAMYFFQNLKFYFEEVDRMESALAAEPEREPSEHCVARCHIGVYFVVYDFAVVCSKRKGSDGTVWLSARVTATWCGIDEKTVRRSLASLVKSGWLVEVRKAHRGRGGFGKYRVVTHEQWIAERGSGSCVPKAADVPI